MKPLFSSRRTRSRSGKSRPDRERRGFTPGTRQRFSRRTALLAGLFTVICLIYLVRLIQLGASGNAYAVYRARANSDGTRTVTVTRQAVRGEIYDRNGNLLVTNHYSYHLQLNYADFIAAGGSETRNSILLSLLESISRDGEATRPEDYFPLEGTYPDLVYREDVKDVTSSTYYQLSRVLAYTGLSSGSSADALVAYYVRTYGLGARNDGIPLYTGEEITRLLRIYYDMDRCHFSAVQPYTLASDIGSGTIAAQKEAGTPGVEITVRADRVYCYPGYASHILGRVGSIRAEDWSYYNARGYAMNAMVGLFGCESAFEDELRGVDGEVEMTLDAKGNVLSQKVLREPVDGKDIRLTLDIERQIAVEDALRQETTDGASATAGACVVQDSATGQILAIASAPTYDLGLYHLKYDELSRQSGTPLLNRACGAAYTPGNLMGPAVTAALLDTGTLDTTDRLEDNGSFTAGNRRLVCSRPGGHGAVAMLQALREGCPVYFARAGGLLGADILATYEEAFGFGQKTGLEVAEIAGSRTDFSRGTEETAGLAGAGQSGIEASPLQLCSYLSTVLNGGSRYRSQLLLEVRSFVSGDIIKKTAPELISYRPIGDRAQLVIESALTARGSQSEETAVLRENGWSVGVLSEVSGNRALLLAFTTPAGGNNGRTTAVSVVLEGNADAEAALRVAVAALRQE